MREVGALRLAVGCMCAVRVHRVVAPVDRQLWRAPIRRHLRSPRRGPLVGWCSGQRHNKVLREFQVRFQPFNPEATVTQRS